MNQPIAVSRKLSSIKRVAPLTLLFSAALILTGCTDDNDEEATEAIDTARTILEEDCDMHGAVNNCTDWLTDLVSASYDAYDAVEDPSEEATTRYDYLNENSGEYAGLGCPDTDHLDSSCVAQHVGIKTTAEMLIEELEAR